MQVSSEIKKDEAVDMIVAGIVLDPASNAPIVILKDLSGTMVMPIWIGIAEATAIAAALKSMEIVRPMTHDLLKTIIDQFGGVVQRVYIRGIEENTFYADIEILIGSELRIIDARPSDAIALAIRTGSPIKVARSVLNESQVTLAPLNPENFEEIATAGVEKDSHNSDFNSIEKEKWEEILAEMDPEDFKFKM